MKKEEQMERFPEERSVRGKIVVKGDGSRHLVVRTFAHAVKGRMLGLLSLDAIKSEVLSKKTITNSLDITVRL